MADIVNTGATANDGSGDDLRTSFQLINERFQQLLGTLSQITWAPGLAISATPLRQWTVVAGQAYVAASNHIAGATFAADLAAGKWLAVDVAQVISDLDSDAPGKGGELVRIKDGRTVQEYLDDLAGTAGDQEVGTNVHTFSKLNQALEAIDWSAQVVPAGLSVLRYIPVAEWPAFYTGASTYDIGPALQSAVDAGASVVHLPHNGVVKLRTAVRISSNTTLDLNGCKVVRDAELTNLFRNKTDGTIGGYSASKNIRIVNGAIDVNGFAVAGASAGEHPTNCTPIGFIHTTGAEVRGVEIYGTKGWHCIEFNACRDSRALYNHFHDNDTTLVTAEVIQIDAALDFSTYPWEGPYDNTPCDGITVYKNRFVNCAVGVGTHSSTTSASNTHKRISIEKNIFEDLVYPAVRGLNWAGVELLVNTAENCCRYQGGGDYAAFEFGTSDEAFVVSHYKVKKNTIKRIGGGNPNNGSIGVGRGINFVGSGLRFFLVGVDENTVENCARHGITMDCVGSGTLQGNTVTGCAGTGIWGYNVRRLSVTGNVAYGNASQAGRYDMAMGGGGAPDNCVVDGNTVGTYSTLTASASLVWGENRVGA